MHKISVPVEQTINSSDEISKTVENTNFRALENVQNESSDPSESSTSSSRVDNNFEEDTNSSGVYLEDSQYNMNTVKNIDLHNLTYLDNYYLYNYQVEVNSSNIRTMVGNHGSYTSSHG